MNHYLLRFQSFDLGVKISDKDVPATVCADDHGLNRERCSMDDRWFSDKQLYEIRADRKKIIVVIDVNSLKMKSKLFAYRNFYYKQTKSETVECLTYNRHPLNYKWASWDYGTYHIGDQRRLRRSCASTQSRQSLRCSHTWSIEEDEGFDQETDT